jgi:hypothetical protein
MVSSVIINCNTNLLVLILEQSVAQKKSSVKRFKWKKNMCFENNMLTCLPNQRHDDCIGEHFKINNSTMCLPVHLET